MKWGLGVCVLVAIAFGVIFLCSRGVGTLDAPALTLTVKVPPQLADASVSAWAIRMERPEAEFGHTSSAVLEQGIVDQASGQIGRGLLTWDELEPGRYLVGACFSPFQDYFRSVTVDVPAAGGAVAEIELAKPEGSMWRRARVVGTGDPSRNWGEASAPVAADGSFVLPPRQMGKRELSLYVRGVAPNPVAILHKEVVVVPGTDEVRVTLPALYQLTVIWPGDDAREVHVQSVDRADPMQAREANHEGFAVIDALPAGRYSVTVGDEEVTVVVPAQSELRFR